MAATSSPAPPRLTAAAAFLRRHPGILVMALVAGIALVQAGRNEQLPGQGGPGSASSGQDAASTSDEAGVGGDGSGEEGVDATGGAGGGDAADGGQGDRGAEGEAGGPSAPASEATTDGSSGPDSTTPVDVAHERPEVDLAEVPDGQEPVAVARWWAAAYTAHAGAERGTELARRLGPLTTAALRDRLAGTPPAASYGEPVEIEGVSAREPTEDGSVWVTVETPGALVVYDLVLVRGNGGIWRVDEVQRL